MKKFFFYFLLIWLLPGSFFSNGIEKDLSSDKLVFDLGEIREGMNPRVWFSLTNTGTEEIKIREIRTFAACVQSSPLKKNVLAPGETFKLDLVFESLGYGGAAIDKHIEVHYDNPSTSPLNLRVKGTVLPLESYQASLGEMTYNFFVLVDIRPAKDCLNEHILGALNVPVEKMESWVSSVSQSFSKELIIYVISEDGNESDRMVKFLQEKGYIQFISLVGGMKEWKQQHGTKFLVSKVI
jgi:rhodanese-related sulfurtransferase